MPKSRSSSSSSGSSYSYSYSRSRSASPAAKTAAGKDKAVPDKERHQRRSSSSGSAKDRGSRRGKGEGAPKILHVSNLTRNVTADHLREIFSNFGEVKTVELAMDNTVQLPKGYAFVEYSEKEEVDAAIKHMAGGQIDGQNVMVHIMGQTPKPPPANPPPATLLAVAWPAGPAGLRVVARISASSWAARVELSPALMISRAPSRVGGTNRVRMTASRAASKASARLR